MIAKRIVVALVLLAVAVFAGAQSLMDDPEYRALVEESDRLRAAAQTAIDEGRYGDAVELAEQAEAKAAEAEEYAQIRVLRFRANSWVNTHAPAHIARAERMRASEFYPDEWARANELMTEARQSFANEQWLDALNSARSVARALEGVQPPPMVVQPAPAPAPAPAPRPAPTPAPAAEPALPAVYIVRLIPERRDSFWRIAEYDFIYGDPWKWPILYEANRDRIPDPNNPHLILPGMEMRIPSVDGERREGVWNPEDRR